MLWIQNDKIKSNSKEIGMKIVARSLLIASALFTLCLPLLPAHADSGGEREGLRDDATVQACGFYATVDSGIRQAWYHHCGSGSALVWVDMPWPTSNYYTCFSAGQDKRLANNTVYARSDGEPC